RTVVRLRCPHLLHPSRCSGPYPTPSSPPSHALEGSWELGRGEVKKMRSGVERGMDMGVEVRLRCRDRAALRWLCEQRVARVDQMGTVLGRLAGGEPLGRSGVQRVVKRWVDAGLVERWRPTERVGAVVVPTVAASRLVGRSRLSRRPGYGAVEHA